MSQNKVIIVGAGAAGMTAAIFAAREGAQVVLLEHKDRVGKKILSTGNGRCNLSNRLQEPFRLPQWVSRIFHGRRLGRLRFR
ncbi:MAG: FAD-dependent oxidoreductase [Clostridium fessum]